MFQVIYRTLCHIPFFYYRKKMWLQG